MHIYYVNPLDENLHKQVQENNCITKWYNRVEDYSYGYI